VGFKVGEGAGDHNSEYVDRRGCHLGIRVTEVRRDGANPELYCRR